MLEANTIRTFITDEEQDQRKRADILGELAISQPALEQDGMQFFEPDQLAQIFRDRLNIRALSHRVISDFVGDDLGIGRVNAATIFNRYYGEKLRSLEDAINSALQKSFRTVISDPAWVSKMQAIFTEESSRVYEAKSHQSKVDWQKPEWQPHEVHMQYLEQVWIGIQPLLDEYGLELDQSLRDSFMQSREKEITATDHNRRFFGVLLDKDSRKPALYFELNVPHSHAQVAYNEAPTIRLSFLRMV